MGHLTQLNEHMTNVQAPREPPHLTRALAIEAEEGVSVFEELDELARGLAENEVSRRQAIKWAGYSVLGATLSSMGFADTAEALTRNARRRCRSKGGTPVEVGNCHCTLKCDAPDPTKFACQNNPSCRCFRTTEGEGFCGNLGTCSSLQPCTSSSDCEFGIERCVHTCCPSGGSFCVSPCANL